MKHGANLPIRSDSKNAIYLLKLFKHGGRYGRRALLQSGCIARVASCEGDDLRGGGDGAN